MATQTQTDTVSKKQQYIWPCANTYYREPLVVERAEGMRVWDVEGRSYLDFFGGVLTVSIGHCHPEINAAIEAQMKKVQHTSTLYINQPVVELAEKLAEITPGRLQQSYFTNSGTEADETALVVAKLHTGAQEIVALRHGYSGRSHAMMGASGHSNWKVLPSSVPGVVHAAAPYCYRCPFGLTYPSCELRCATDVEELIQTTTSGEIAAFLAEPIQGVGGFITPPKEYFKVVRDIIKKYGGLLIIDEVQTGWGRTGEVDVRDQLLGGGAGCHDLCQRYGKRRSHRSHDCDSRSGCQLQIADVFDFRRKSDNGGRCTGCHPLYRGKAAGQEREGSGQLFSWQAGRIEGQVCVHRRSSRHGADAGSGTHSPGQVAEPASRRGSL